MSIMHDRDTIPVVILCGGKGTRMREETEYRPKPMVEVGGRPMLWHIMKGYSAVGYRSFVLCLGYKGSVIRDYFLNYEAMNLDFTLSLGQHRSIWFHGQHDESDWQVTLAETGQETMTGGRIKRIQRYIGGDTFFATYGDGVADINLPELLAFHRRMGRVATITGLHPTSKYGVVDTDDNGMVQQFREKPQLDGMISGGFFVFNRAIFDYLDSDCVLEEEPFHRLAAEGQMAVYQHRGFWKSVDTYRDYQEINALWDSGDAPWKTWLAPEESAARAQGNGSHSSVPRNGHRVAT